MNYSEELNKVLHQSRQCAIRLGSPQVTPDHLLLGILSSSESKAYHLLKSSGVDTDKARTTLESRNFHEGSEAVDPSYDKQTERILRILDLEARSYHTDIPHSEHLLFALLRERVNKAAVLLKDSYNVTYESMEKLMPKPQQTPKAGADFSSDLEDDNGAGEMPEDDSETRKKRSWYSRAFSRSPSL